MVGLGCLVKDTRIVMALQEILEARAAEHITMGLPFSFSNAYSGLIKDGIEIDLESVGAIYADIFDLSEDSFTSLDSIERIVGRKFEDALDKISTIRPFTGVRKIGTLSPGKAAANNIALMFDKGMKFDEGTSSPMRVFQEKMQAAAEYYLDRTVFPSEGDKATRIQQVESMLESGTLTPDQERRYKIILKRLKGKQSFLETLEEAFEFKTQGYERIDGGMNNINDVLAEFQKEIDKYIEGLYEKYNAAKDPDRKSELLVAIKSFEKYTETVRSKMMDLYLSENEITDSIKQILISQGFGRKVNDKKGKLSREITKLDKLYAIADTDVARAEIDDRRTVARAELDSIQKAEADLAAAEQSLKKLDPMSPDYVNMASVYSEQIFKLKNYLDGINQALDWKKLTFVSDVIIDDDGNVVNSGINALKFYVARALRNTGFSSENIKTVQSAFETEYLRLKKDIQEKKLSELIRKNEANPIQGSNTETRKLAKLYSYGWFEEHPDTYEKIVRDALGVNEVDSDTFDKLKKLAKDLYLIYDQKQTDEFLKTALNDIGQQSGDLLEKYKRDKDMMYKMASIIDDILSVGMRALLTSISNGTQNIISGAAAVFSERLVQRQEGIKNADTFQEGYIPSGNKDFSDFNNFVKEMSSSIFQDISKNKGTSYGDLSSTFMYRGGLDRLVDKIENPKVRATAAFLTGRILLDGVDSRFKYSLTHTYFISNMAKILETQYGYDKKDALREISEKLYGYSFENAMANVRVLIDKINAQKGPDETPFRSDETMVLRMADDLVKMNLLDIESKIEGKNITEDVILAAYKSAYENAGYRIGHIPNNPFSRMVQKYNASISEELNKALKRGDSAAYRWKLMETINRSFISPFGNGGMNWVVIAGELTGYGALRVLPYYMEKKKGRIKNLEDFDITNFDQLREYMDVLSLDRKNKIMLTRGVVGAAMSFMLSSLVYAMLPGDDDEEKMNAFNAFFEANSKYYKYVAWLPLSWLYIKNSIQNLNVDYLKQILNLRFQEMEIPALAGEVLYYFGKGETAQSWGKVGELMGNFFKAPIPSYRILKQLFDLTYAVTGIEEAPPLNKNNYDPSLGFWHGFVKFGVTNDLGYRPNFVRHNLSSLPGSGEATLGALDEMGIQSIEQLKEYLVLTYPDKSFSDALGALKKTTTDGKQTAMFSRDNIAQIEEIISNDNRAPLMKMEDIFKDKEQLKLIKKKKIYTVPQLNDAILNGNLFNDPALNLTDDQIKNILEKVENYYEKVEK